MKTLRYLISIVVFASILFASYSTLMALVSEPPGDGGGGGGGWGKWYNTGDIYKTIWCDYYTQTIVFFPYLHYEIRNEKRPVTMVWQIEKCRGSGSQCMIGWERETWKHGGC